MKSLHEQADPNCPICKGTGQDTTTTGFTGVCECVKKHDSRNDQCTCNTDWEGEPLIGGYAGCPVHDPNINKEESEELIAYLKNLGSYVEPPIPPIQQQLTTYAETIALLTRQVLRARERVKELESEANEKGLMLHRIAKALGDKETSVKDHQLIEQADYIIKKYFKASDILRDDKQSLQSE